MLVLTPDNETIDLPGTPRRPTLEQLITRLVRAAGKDDLSAVENELRAIKEFEDRTGFSARLIINSRELSGSTFGCAALDAAAERGNKDIIRTLLLAGAEVTPLAFGLAMENGHAEVVRELSFELMMATSTAPSANNYIRHIIAKQQHDLKEDVRSIASRALQRMAGRLLGDDLSFSMKCNFGEIAKFVVENGFVRNTRKTKAAYFQLIKFENPLKGLMARAERVRSRGFDLN